MSTEITLEKALELEFEILEAMDTYGGSFVKQLAVLYRMADPFNKRKLLDAFDNYFFDYYKMVTRSN